MNDLNGRIVPDTSTANPPAYNTWKGADRETLMNAVLMFEEANKKLNKENIALRADMAKLEAENAELREKCMTRFERIQKASPEQMAATIAFIYDIGYTDGREDADDDHHWLEWLQEIGTI